MWEAFRAPQAHCVGVFARETRVFAQLQTWFCLHLRIKKHSEISAHLETYWMSLLEGGTCLVPRAWKPRNGLPQLNLSGVPGLL